ncbi:MAG TPA: ATP-binding protein [Caldithrix abyssi]|uniref:ATP-binding protein n=1 Tax=Caldithrix abyssi TaxID=187145 RepID=A0A7V5VFN9_CALAY|nr:ATP-binding protein [Caldithrix abyssi]
MLMYNVNRTENGLCFEFSSSYIYVDKTVENCVSFVREKCLDISEFDLSVTLHEVLSNAVRHGNKDNPEKKVYCNLYWKDDLLRIEVRDEGKGLPSGDSLKRESGTLEPHGMGMSIIEGFDFECSYVSEKNIVLLKKKVKVHPN